MLFIAVLLRFTGVIILGFPDNRDEQLVEDQERKVLALRDTIGEAKWCKPYAVEMAEAFTVYRLVAGQ